MSASKALIDKLRTGRACVAVVGLGYVGLPLACRFAEAGLRTLGFDIDQEKVQALGRGETYLSTVPAERVAQACRRGLTASTDIALARQADAIIICVPTPLKPSREPDLQYVTGTLES